jgi:hypothetical protein
MTDFEETVLKVVDCWCSPTSGYAVTGLAPLVGRQPGHDSDRAHSAFVSRALLSLERAGRVRRMDADKPIVWCRVLKTA